MSRSMPAVAVGAVLALVALAAVLVMRPDAAPTSAERADALARQLRCPDCQGLSVADSPTASATEIRRQIDDLLADGATDDDVRAHFVARYGEWILLAPSSPLAWIAPIAVVVIAAVALLFRLSRRGTAGAAQQATAEGLTADERRRLHEEAEALDA